MSGFLLLGEPLGFDGATPPIGVTNPNFPTNADHVATLLEYEGGALFVTSTGTLSATRTLTLPLVKGVFFFVYNATTGTQTINVGGASGTTVAVPKSAFRIIHCPDGANYVAASVDLASPGPIGSGTPSTAVFTSLAFSGANVGPGFGETTDSGGDADALVLQAAYNHGHVTCHGALTNERIRGFPANAGSFWDVENGTTGGHCIIAKIGDGGGYYNVGVKIPPGRTVRVAVTTDLLDLIAVGAEIYANDVELPLGAAIVSNTTLDQTKAVHPVDSSSGGFTITLPAAQFVGQRHLVVDWGYAIEASPITVTTGTSVKIQNPLTGDRTSASFSFGATAGVGFRNGACFELIWTGVLWGCIR